MADLAVRQSREFTLSDAEYRSIRDRVYDLAGIKLGDQKQDLVYSRLTKRLRLLGLADFTSYLRLIDSPEGEDEIEFMLNALTTNLTSFFRRASLCNPVSTNKTALIVIFASGHQPAQLAKSLTALQ